MAELNENLITRDFVVRIYEYLTLCKVRELTGWNSEMADGQADGYLQCLCHFFGTSSEEEAEIAANNGQSIFDVVDRILLSFRKDLDPYLQKYHKDNSWENWDKAYEIAERKIRDYVVNNFDECYRGIKLI